MGFDGIKSRDIVNKPGKDAQGIEDEIFTIEDLCGHSKVSNLQIESSAALAGDEDAKYKANNDLNGEVGITEKRGIKRCQDEFDRESSVHVVYSSLPSRSKRKLEELIRQWSDWHAQNCASAKDVADSLESGEETYFPALHVGSDKASTMSYSMDIHVSKRQHKESLLNECSPMYERGYAIGLSSDLGASEECGVDLREAPRCFNCGSFNHPLSGCPKPLDRAIVNSARKEFQSKKNQSSGPRIPTRYYQDSPGGKFDGLKPGALSKETRKLLNLGELDPPPWLNRMRELGYPLGYLHVAEEDQPSGIAIFGDETQNGNLSNGHNSTIQNSQKKMVIDFPGINAPMPEKADPWLWAEPRSHILSDPFHNRPDNRSSYSPNFLTNGHFHSDHGLRKHIGAPLSPYGLESSPPVHHPYNYHPSEPFSPRGIPSPETTHYGRPYLHYNYGTF